MFRWVLAAFFNYLLAVKRGKVPHCVLRLSAAYGFFSSNHIRFKESLWLVFGLDAGVFQFFFSLYCVGDEDRGSLFVFGTCKGRGTRNPQQINFGRGVWAHVCYWLHLIVKVCRYFHFFCKHFSRKNSRYDEVVNFLAYGFFCTFLLWNMIFFCTFVGYPLWSCNLAHMWKSFLWSSLWIRLIFAE